MRAARSTEARRKAGAGLVSIRIGATEIGGKPVSLWVPVAVAKRIERMARQAAVEADATPPET